MDTETIKTTIKSHGWHDVEINGSLMTGDTYPCKDYIVKRLGGKWDKERRGWVVDMEKVRILMTPAGTLI